METKEFVCSASELEVDSTQPLYATVVCSDEGCPVAAMEKNRAAGGACRAHLGAHHLSVKNVSTGVKLPAPRRSDFMQNKLDNQTHHLLTRLR